MLNKMHALENDMNIRWRDGRTYICKGKTKTCPFWETHSLQWC